MDASQVVVTPTRAADALIPSSIGVAVVVALTAGLLIIASRFDPSKGVLTLSILITISFGGAVAFCLFYTVPNDEVTPAVVGGLTAGFGAVCAHWLGRTNGTSNGTSNGAPPPTDGAKD